MDRMINCTGSILEDICLNDSWYRIIKQRNHVRIPDENPISEQSYITDQPNNIWEILDRDGVNVHSNSNFVREAELDPRKALMHPNDIYVFSQDEQSARKNTYSFGTLNSCPSVSSIRSLKRHWKYETIAGERYSWKQFMSKFHEGSVPPSNSLIIIDRYLFSFNPDFLADWRNGVRNLHELLDQLLPKEFNDCYHVLIVFDENTISRGANMQDIASACQYVKNVLARSFPIVIELLSIDKNSEGFIYAETHDRRIVSNYYIIRCSHGFSAFVPEESQMSVLIPHGETYAAFSQTIEFESIYAGIDDEDQDVSSLPVKGCDYIIDTFKESLLRAGEKYSPGYNLAIDGKIQQRLERLHNRIIRL